MFRKVRNWSSNKDPIASDTCKGSCPLEGEDQVANDGCDAANHGVLNVFMMCSAEKKSKCSVKIEDMLMGVFAF